jgi:hypothetical protein
MEIYYIIMRIGVSCLILTDTRPLKIPTPLNKVCSAILHSKKLAKCTTRPVRYIFLNPCALLILTSWLQVEKLLFSQAGRLAQRRLAYGKKLNHLESSVSRDMS